MMYFLCLDRDDYHFEKQSLIKPCLFHVGYKPERYIPLGPKPCLFHWGYV